jgi:hypothetical protein
MAELTIRNAQESDLEALYQLQLDPEYNRMAAFGSAVPEDRTAFMNHKNKILRDPACFVLHHRTGLRAYREYREFFLRG